MIDVVYLDIPVPTTLTPIIEIGEYTFYMFKFRKDTIVYRLKEHQVTPQKWCKLVLSSYAKPSSGTCRKSERYYITPELVKNLSNPVSSEYNRFEWDSLDQLSHGLI